MNQRSAWLAGIAAGVLVWIAASELQWPARLVTALLLGPAPVAFMIQARMTDQLPRPFPRIPVYAGSMIVLWLLGAICSAAALASGFDARTLGLAPIGAPAFVAWTALTIVAGGAVIMAFRAGGVRETQVMRDLIPVTAREKIVFAGLSISAGLCEEIAFRGFLLAALTAATGSIVAGVTISSVAFGILHAHQSPGGAARAAVLGAVLAVPVLTTGSLWPAIAGHALIDLAGGLWLHRWLLRS